MRDLFEEYLKLPESVNKIIQKHSTWREYTIDSITLFEAELLTHGYAFDYWLDMMPFNLHKI